MSKQPKVTCAIGPPTFAQSAVPDFKQPAPQARLHDVVFESSQLAQVIVDSKGHLVLANQQARQLYGIRLDDLGRPFHDIEISYQPAELRSLIAASGEAVRNQRATDRKTGRIDPRAAAQRAAERGGGDPCTPGQQ